MILYYSGRCAGKYDLPSKPELLFRETYIMMSFTYAPKADIKRFLTIVGSRNKKQKNNNEL